MLISTSLVPRPAPAFGCTKEHGGPVMGPHVSDIEGRKVVEIKDLIERGPSGVQNSNKRQGTR